MNSGHVEKVDKPTNGGDVDAVGLNEVGVDIDETGANSDVDLDAAVPDRAANSDCEAQSPPHASPPVVIPAPVALPAHASLGPVSAEATHEPAQVVVAPNLPRQQRSAREISRARRLVAVGAQLQPHTDLNC